jgi:hypothetical protein
MAINLNLKQLDAKKAVIAVVGVAVLAAGGWFAWETFFNEPPPPPPPPPKAAAKPKLAASKAAAVPKEKLVGDLMEVSGLKRQVQQIPEKVMMGARQSSARNQNPELVAEVEKIMLASFKPELFQQGVRDALTKGFDAKRVDNLMKAYASPLQKKMAALESAEIKPEDLAAFAKSLKTQPPSAARLDLLKQLDAATQGTAFSVEIVGGVTRAMLSGVVGGDAAKLAKIDREYEKQKARVAGAMENVMTATLAFVYRDVSDDDLAAYAKFLGGEDAKWLITQSMGGLLDTFKSSAQNAGEQIAALAKDSRFAKRGKPMAVSPGSEPAAQPAGRPLTGRARLDARECLKQSGNAAIQQCAEAYR